MKWVKDTTGRFSKRPYYDDKELDIECESLVTSFLTQKYGSVSFPLSTEDLTILIEQHVTDLDIYADLSSEGDDVEGMTLFPRGKKPQVLIDQKLSTQNNRENRLRTTLSHELGHVKLHGFLIPLQAQPQLFSKRDSQLTIVCKRDSIINATKVDWMEWQAGYASGAYLMPYTAIRTIVQQTFESHNAPSIVSVASSLGQTLIKDIHTRFQVSEDAARVRLLKLEFLTSQQTPMSLFG